MKTPLHSINVMIKLNTMSNGDYPVITSIEAFELITPTMEVLGEFSEKVSSENTLNHVLESFNIWLCSLGKKEEIRVFDFYSGIGNPILMAAYKTHEITPCFGFMWQSREFIV
ncbi:hypothetical protein L3V77_02815 [Vibrio sp. DW001]|uniref:hypothetical protein n=1 Tax=Vibrio sp. DW001 TaxID=2912315 RepID=UPI0023AEDB9C|nr:hypothetical protein [Vibrio sp. DW001]WED27184.1 hypothetical protein L3V77_02815 [Vibrio sp. DW001]